MHLNEFSLMFPRASKLTIDDTSSWQTPNVSALPHSCSQAGGFKEETMLRSERFGLAFALNIRLLPLPHGRFSSPLNNFLAT